MLNMLQQMLNQQSISNPQTPEDELLAHQEPIAAAMRALMKILEYEKRLLPADLFKEMVDSLQVNLNKALDNVKIPPIPPSSDIVSINGEPVNSK